jgi:phosphoglycerate dehydrogenase-like enzyme
VSSRTVVVVQGAGNAGQVPGIEGAEAHAELRFATTAEELEQHLPGVEVLLGWDFREAGLETAWRNADRLRWIHWAGAGVDAVLFPELIASDVILTNSRGIFDRAMAEYVLGLILAFAKRFPESFGLQAERQWRHRLNEQVKDRRVLVVGVGSIGREIARLLRAAGLRVEGVGRRARGADPDFSVIHAREDLHTVLPRADYVVIIVPLTDETRQLIGAAELKAMKSTARLINLARGQVLDEAALVQALARGDIAGAALDVFEVEPLPAESPLWSMDNVIVSPHMSGDFFGYPEAVVQVFVENLRRYRAGESLLNVVDKCRGFVPSDTGAAASP